MLFWQQFPFLFFVEIGKLLNYLYRKTSKVLKNEHIYYIIYEILCFFNKESIYMNSLVKVVPNIKKFNDYLFEVKKGTNPMMLSGLTDARKSTFGVFN